MENGGSGIGDQAKRDAQRIAGDVQERLEGMRGQVEERLEGMRGYAEDAGEWVREFAREKPMAAVALAAGLGFLFGRMLSRS
jgi:ElaB/YqjD/DUF883 family membrane-anchored ribosome-binding protein